MHRRSFVTAISAGTLLAGAPLFLRGGHARAQSASFPRTLVNVMLLGGADFRHVLVPAPDFDPTYVSAFWNARRGLYPQNYSDYASLYAAEYRSVTDPLSGRVFGIHRDCGWLASRFAAGQAAIICNVLGSDNRRHDHSQLIVDTGDPAASQADTLRDGWGGRLVEASSGSSKVVVVSKGMSLFAMGTSSRDRLARVIHAKNTRDLSLPGVDNSRPAGDSRNAMTRALHAYYSARAPEIATEKPAQWPYRRFFQHYQSLQSFGATLAARLAAHPLPSSLATLTLHNAEFAQQCRNAYDSVLAADILGGQVISMSYDGWDSHAAQQNKLSLFLPDVLGAQGGLARLSAQLETDVPGATENMLYLFASDFGRQLAANGGLGTDHGRGNYFIMVGGGVRAGVYGDMFPAREARPDPADSQSRAPFQITGADILGRTALERVLAHLCDWVSPATGSTVFPGAATSIVEPGVDLSRLLS